MNQTSKHPTANPEPLVLRRRIGSTTYQTRIFFNPEAKETLDDKVLRLLKNDLNRGAGHGMIGIPQTGRLSERSIA
jgi:hypothetical protein